MQYDAFLTSKPANSAEINVKAKMDHKIPGKRNLIFRLANSFHNTSVCCIPFIPHAADRDYPFRRSGVVLDFCTESADVHRKGAVIYVLFAAIP